MTKSMRVAGEQKGQKCWFEIKWGFSPSMAFSMLLQLGLKFKNGESVGKFFFFDQSGSFPLNKLPFFKLIFIFIFYQHCFCV